MKISDDVALFLGKRLSISEGLLLNLESGGCTGFKASFEKIPISDTEGLSLADSAPVYWHPESAHLLSGALLTLKSELLGDILNLTVDKNLYEQCGCGSSFAPKKLGD